MSKASEEAQKQLDRIVALGYPDVADMSAAAFRALARPLIRALEDSDLGTQILLVPTRELVSPGIVDRAYVDQPYGWFHHDAAARYRQFSSAGWFRTSGRSVLPGGRAAYGNVLHQSRARCGAQADRFRRAFAAYVGRGSCDCHAASGMVVGEERFQFVGIAFRGWSCAEYLDEPECASIGCGMAEFPSYLAWQRVLRVSSRRQFVPLTFC